MKVFSGKLLYILCAETQLPEGYLEQLVICSIKCLPSSNVFSHYLLQPEQEIMRGDIIRIHIGTHCICALFFIEGKWSQYCFLEFTYCSIGQRWRIALLVIGILQC